MTNRQISLPIDILTPTQWIYLKLCLTALLWGGTFIAGRIAMESLPILLSASTRFILAAILLVLLTLVQEKHFPRLNIRLILITAAMGASGVFSYNIFFFAALSELPAAQTALYVAFNPICTALIMFVILRESYRFMKWMGILIALMGAITVISRGQFFFQTTQNQDLFQSGDLYMLCAVFSWVCYTILGRFTKNHISPLVTTTYAALWGTLFLCLTTLYHESPQISLTLFSQQSALALLYLAAAGTVLPFMWYAEGVHHLGPARTAVFTNLVPVFGVILAIILLGESLSLPLWIGGGCVMIGLYLTNKY